MFLSPSASSSFSSPSLSFRVLLTPLPLCFPRAAQTEKEAAVIHRYPLGRLWAALGFSLRMRELPSGIIAGFLTACLSEEWRRCSSCRTRDGLAVTREVARAAVGRKGTRVLLVRRHARSESYLIDVCLNASLRYQMAMSFSV